MWGFSRRTSIERAVQDTGDIIVSEATIHALGRHGVRTLDDLLQYAPSELIENYGIDYYDALSLGHLMVKQRRAKSGVPKAEHMVIHEEAHEIA